LLSLKTVVNVSQYVCNRIGKKTWEKTYFLIKIFKATNEKSKMRIPIQIHKPVVVRIRGSASVTKRHGFGTPSGTEKNAEPMLQTFVLQLCEAAVMLINPTKKIKEEEGNLRVPIFLTGSHENRSKSKT
jgi:hypothetical protein